MKELKAREYKRFEDIKQIRADGTEFWSARELAPALEYTKWENFQNVIKRAMIVSDGTLWEVQTALYFRWTCLPDGAVPELAAGSRRDDR